MTHVIDRAVTMLAERNLRPFRRSDLFEDPDPAWRVSSDVFEELRQHVRDIDAGEPAPDMGMKLLGFDLTVDDQLPPKSMLLEDPGTR